MIMQMHSSSKQNQSLILIRRCEAYDVEQIVGIHFHEFAIASVSMSVIRRIRRTRITVARDGNQVNLVRPSSAVV